MKNAKELLDMYYLDMRSALLETAATLDRLEISDNNNLIFTDPRLKKMFECLDIIKQPGANRVEKFLENLSEK
jgi:hypothetical protein